MLRTQARRESILTEATKLFATNGFAGVSTEDIGASVGISGPSVYNHFPTKSDILLAAMLRGDEWLRLDMNRAFAQASDPRDCLTRLLHSYCTFVLDNPHLLQVLVSESNHLPEPARHRVRAAQHTYIDDWVNLLRQIHPSWDAIPARIRVQAVQTMMNDIAVIPELREQPGVESTFVISVPNFSPSATATGLDDHSVSELQQILDVNLHAPRALTSRLMNCIYPVELPGIEPSPKIWLTCGNVESDDAKQRENT